MIARAIPISRVVPGTPGLVGSKRPLPHRFHMANGRVIEGDLHRSPGTRLADHVTTLKGMISVTDARCAESGNPLGYVLLNQDHVAFIEELTPLP